jgi:hypothetical protein
LAAVLIAGPRLLAARRAPEAGTPAIRASGAGIPATGVVLLLTVGYAALARLLVTLVAGYPLTWTTALIAGSVVGAGALLTARVVAGPVDTTGDADIAPTQEPHGSPRSRAAGSSAWRVEQSWRVPGLPASACCACPLNPSPPEATYNGRVPGPPITATVGDLIDVTLRNTDIDDGVTLHWHGYDVACGEDGAPGVTQDAVAPGEKFVYRFRADQVGTYWYHTNQASHRGVRRGRYGTLLVTPRAPRVDDAASMLDLTLPVHTFDGTVVLADQDGRTEHHAPAGTNVRLRLVDTDSDPHRFALAGTPFRVMAVDVSLWSRAGACRGCARPRCG